MYSGLKNIFDRIADRKVKVSNKEAEEIEKGKKTEVILKNNKELEKDEKERLAEGNIIREIGEKALNDAKKSDSAINPEEAEEKIEEKK